MRRFLLGAVFALALAVCAFPQEEPRKEAGESQEATDRWFGWKWANFLILAGGLGYLIAKNAGPFFRSRSEEISKGIEEAGRIKKDAEARAAEIERRVSALDADIEQLRTHAKAEMAAEGQRIEAETAARLDKVQRQAELEIASMTKAARQELRAYSASLALELAAQRVQGRMSSDIQHRLVDGFVDDLSDNGKLRLTRS